MVIQPARPAAASGWRPATVLPWFTRRLRSGHGSQINQYTTKGQGVSMSWYEFNIHDRVSFRVSQQAPTASLFVDMIAPFLSAGLTHYELTIGGEYEPMENAAFGEAHGETDFYSN